MKQEQILFYHAAGGTVTGMFEAAKEVSESTGSKVWGIGVDFDQYFQVGNALLIYKNTFFHLW
jgi:basic membrane lipoprotein Med (substrate-binding protein (PBP1-ABC) superfamily)